MTTQSRFIDFCRDFFPDNCRSMGPALNRKRAYKSNRPAVYAECNKNDTRMYLIQKHAISVLSVFKRSQTATMADGKRVNSGWLTWRSNRNPVKTSNSGVFRHLNSHKFNVCFFFVCVFHIIVYPHYLLVDNSIINFNNYSMRNLKGSVQKPGKSNF